MRTAPERIYFVVVVFCWKNFLARFISREKKKAAKSGRKVLSKKMTTERTSGKARIDIGSLLDALDREDEASDSSPRSYRPNGHDGLTDSCSDHELNEAVEAAEAAEAERSDEGEAAEAAEAPALSPRGLPVSAVVVAGNENREQAGLFY